MRGVLIFDGTPRTVVTIGRSLHGRGIPVYCGGLRGQRLSLFSNSILREFEFGGSNDSVYEKLCETLTAHDIDTIIPCSDKALAVLLTHYQDLGQHAALACPPPEIADKVLQKANTLHAARAATVPVPQTYAIGGSDDLAKLKAEIRFPAIVKPASTASTPFKVKHFQGYAELESSWPLLPNGDFLVQEFVPGEGLGVSTIVAEGRPLVLFAHRRLHEYPADGGVGVLFVSEAVDPRLAADATALLKYLQWQGPAMVEFRHDRRTGRYALMEVNGRFWGSLPLSMYAGLDFPFWEWQILHRQAPVVPERYAVGLTVRWTAGEIQRFADLVTDSRLRKALHVRPYETISQLLCSFAPGTRSALFSVGDPLPETLDVARTLVRVLASKIWRLLKCLLSASVRDRLDQFRLLDSNARKTYLRRWVAGKRTRRSSRSCLISPDGCVTMVCRANRIRSPLAAAILEGQFRNTGRGYRIQSAGTRTPPGAVFDPRANAAAESMGLRLNGRPQLLSAAIVESSDLLIVMDRVVEAELLTQFPWAAPKVCLIGTLAFGNGRRDEIADPDQQPADEFIRSVHDLAATVRELANRLH